jgi:hypothetical protein
MTDIPVVSKELMDQVDRIFAHGGQRAKSHDIRFGQWLVNKIRAKYTKQNEDGSKTYIPISADIVRILFNLENPEFLELMRDYND